MLNWFWPSLSPHVSWFQRLQVIGVFAALIFTLVLPNALHRKLFGRAKPKAIEIVRGRVWQIEYYSAFGQCQTTVVRRGDGKLLVFQPGPLSSDFFAVLSELGELAVVVEPDVAHDTNARPMKLLLPKEVTLIASLASRTMWEKAGDASHINGCFDDASDETTCALMQSFGFVEHISAGSWMLFADFAHVLDVGGKRLVLPPCPIVNAGTDSWATNVCLWICGSFGFRLLFHSYFWYGVPDCIKPGGAFLRFWSQLVALQPDMVIFKHGKPLDGAQMHTLRLGEDLAWFPSQVQLVNVD